MGEIVRGRCKATNECAYCARLSAVETAEMLALDAIEGGQAPRVWAVLTTRSTEPDPAAFYRSREKVQRALKRRWPGCELAWVIEFTTGKGPNAGGARRPHWNVLIKGIDPAELEQLDKVIKRVWCAREDAEPEAQFTGPVSEIGGLMRYLALHFLKESQQPPKGWRGHRFSATRGYLWTTTPQARQAARASLREKRELHKVLKRGLTGVQAEQAVRQALQLASETTWELVWLTNAQAGLTKHPPPARKRLLDRRFYRAAYRAGPRNDRTAYPGSLIPDRTCKTPHFHWGSECSQGTDHPPPPCEFRWSVPFEHP